jgi:hypothetical protein
VALTSKLGIMVKISSGLYSAVSYNGFPSRSRFFSLAMPDYDMFLYKLEEVRRRKRRENMD